MVPYVVAASVVAWYVVFAITATGHPQARQTLLRVVAALPFAVIWVRAFNNKFDDQIIAVASLVIVLGSIVIPWNTWRHRSSGDRRPRTDGETGHT